MTTLTLTGTAGDRAEAIAHRCEQARRHGDTWKACCPAHDDSTPSLHITAEAGKVLLHCFAQCTTRAIVEALGLTRADLFEDTGNSKGHRTILHLY